MIPLKEATFEINYEFVASPDTETRLQEAYGMVFEEIENMLTEGDLKEQNNE